MNTTETNRDAALAVMAVKHSQPGDLCAVSHRDIAAWREGRDVKR